MIRYYSKKRNAPGLTTLNYALMGAGAVALFLLYRKFGPQGALSGTDRRRRGAGPPPQGALRPGQEYHRYQPVRRGSDTVCIDRETGEVVSAEVCAREMLRDVGGVFGGSGTLG